jgi:hypothetical protein
MKSLKSIIPHLSDVLLFSEHALYERQRALVRGGLLKATAGRGPGSGVKATADNVAMLIISVLATDSLSNVVKDTGIIAKATRQVPDVDAPPEFRTFQAAVAYCLSTDDDRIASIEVFRTSRTAVVRLRDGHVIAFGKFRNISFVSITALIPQEAFRYVRRLLELTDPPSPAGYNPNRQMKVRPS